MSDVHSAAAPFAAALSAAREEGFDELIILGDLLSYGPEPERCIELAHEAVEKDGARLILGNHDALYLGAAGYAYPEQGWIEESIEWTRARIGPEGLNGLPWQESWSTGTLFVAHANPFGQGDWSYLRSPDDFIRASEALVSGGYAAGVFGHVHRFAQRDGPVQVYTVGSVGQPRSRVDPRPQWAFGELEGTRFELQPRPMAFDWAEHSAALRRTSMSEQAVAQLCRFFQ